MSDTPSQDIQLASRMPEEIVMEDPGAVQPPTATTSITARSTCSTCGAVPTTAIPNQGYVTLVGHATMAFPSLSVEKEFAQLLGKKEFAGLTDRQTLHAVLSKQENRYLARKMCGQFIVYGSGSAPSYILMPEDLRDLDLLVDTLKRPPSTSEFDVVKGRIAGIAPPALCNAQELPIVVYWHLYSFPIETFVTKIPRSEKIQSKEFEAAANETFHRIMRIAGHGVGPTRALAFAGLSYSGLYQLVAEKNGENSSMAEIGVTQSKSNPDRADIRLKFVRRDTGFSETYRFTVNFTGPFEFLEEPLHSSYEIS